MENSHDARRTGRNLLNRPGTALLDDLGRALAATAGAFPVPAAHRRDLPHAIRDLSRLLTQERAELARSYWSAPRFLAAYLHYFLPWSLYRMAWLLPGLDLRLQPGATILDLGSGPLTLPLALWCARPDLRGQPLSFICSDVAVKPMEIGLGILKRLAGPDSPWRVTLQRASLEKALARSGKSGTSERADCVMAGNMLNELSTSRNTSLEQRLEQLMGQAAGRLVPGGRLLLVEPGTRLGGKLIALARKGALSHGLSPLAPCTHQSLCPMLGESLRPPHMPIYTGWCHFFHPSGGVPASLARLAREAHLEKDSLALSCLLLRSPEGKTVTASMPAGGDDSRCGMDSHRALDGLEDLEALYEEIMGRGGEDDAAQRASTASGKPAHMNARVISDLIRLPGEAEPGRYACCERGLALLLDAVNIPSGAFVTVPCPGEERRDSKTGALLVRRERRPSETGNINKANEPTRHKARHDISNKKGPGEGIPSSRCVLKEKRHGQNAETARARKKTAVIKKGRKQGE